MKIKKKLFLLLFAVSGCGTKLPSPPQHFQGTLIDSKIPYGYWVPYYDDGTKPYKTTLQGFLDKKVVCVSADDYGKLKKYTENVFAIIRKQCPQLVK
jgi:hypothetical protein